MKWSIQQLQTLKKKGLSLDETVDVSGLMDMDQQIRDISTVHVKGHAVFSERSVTFMLTIIGEMTLPCSRTLNDVLFPFEIEASETFKLDDWATFDDEEDDVHELDNNTVDLLPYIKERILLEIPIQIFSGDNEGQAPQSGNGWELITEEEQEQKVDPRLKELEKFFDEEK
ncbi:YceD family protein [Texcoconibacillus texcoconensis]|uniref:DUF177 domain-containing protein n=1 Tax=Texcoconibacillus texcoconensis TaxID=1095777 RepID=A0A840QLF5_9BACI|nr:YceD family protein [Texcoconibacillus texcoconensis]MBB5172191.1 uncharacterized protein [Texcoconibacillus texcoconensis]